MLRNPTPSDRSELLNIAVSTGLFTAEEAEGLLGGVLSDLHAGGLPSGHAAIVAVNEDDKALGWAYFAPDLHAEGVWNLWWIGCLPEHHGSGVGRSLLVHFEKVASAAGARILIVETSARPPMSRARRFYAREGYVERGSIPDFYGVGDEKVIFVKQLKPAG